MTGGCEGHFGQLIEFVDGSRTSNRRQDTEMMARTGVNQELQNSENTIDRILREYILKVSCRRNLTAKAGRSVQRKCLYATIVKS